MAKDTTYTLVLYSFNSTNNEGADFTYSVNGGTTYTLEEEPNAKFTSDSVGNTGLIYTGNYVELTTESDSSGDLDISLGKGAGNTTSYFGITGVQLEGAPEPSTWAMLLGGVFLLVFLRVRQRRA